LRIIFDGEGISGIDLLAGTEVVVTSFLKMHMVAYGSPHIPLRFTLPYLPGSMPLHSFVLPLKGWRPGKLLYGVDALMVIFTPGLSVLHLSKINM